MIFALTGAEANNKQDHLFEKVVHFQLPFAAIYICTRHHPPCVCVAPTTLKQPAFILY